MPLYAIRDPANNVYEDPLIDPEHVSDLELGVRRGVVELATPA